MRVAVWSGLLLMASFGTVSGSDWTRFRGPNGQGVTAEKVPVEWSADSAKWTLNLPGEGSSSPIVVGGKIFVTCYSGVDGADSRRTIVCADAQSGKMVWSDSVAGPQRDDSYSGFLREHGYASGTPVSDGKHVYAFLARQEWWPGIWTAKNSGKRTWGRCPATAAGVLPPVRCCTMDS